MGTLARQGWACQSNIKRCRGTLREDTGSGRDIKGQHKETRWKNIRVQGKTLWKILRGQEGTLEKTLGIAPRRKGGALGISQLSSNTPWPSGTTPSSASLLSIRCFRNTSSALACEWRGVINNGLSPCFGRHTQVLVRGQSRDLVAIVILSLLGEPSAVPGRLNIATIIILPAGFR